MARVREGLLYRLLMVGRLARPWCRQPEATQAVNWAWLGRSHQE